VTCPNNQYCDNGTCVDLCTQNKCSSTERCVAGQCMPDSCSNTGCPDGQFCDTATGACRSDPCQVRQCGRGEVCVKQTGKCVADPCASIDCPGPCWTCSMTSDGIGTCNLSGDCREVSTKVGLRGGGCACEVGAGGAGEGATGFAAALLAAAGLVLGRRRRAR
jgi:MYXO-CTERM domain-containing protein